MKDTDLFDECYAEILGSSYEGQDGVALPLVARDYNADSNYFVTFILYNIPKSVYGSDITVQAYAITYPDEVEIKGFTKTVTINGLIDAVA